MKNVLGFYGLAEQPFGVSPDPRFFFLSPTHREALASALCAVSSGRGFTALIGKPGMGKTTLLFDLLSRIEDQAKTAFLFQSQCTPRDLLGNLLEDLEIQDDLTDVARMQRKLNEFLLDEARHGRHVVVVIDEAQNLDDSVLEVVRMLSNFETPYEKLMHFVLAGQPQLAEKLASPRMLQLKQRISIIARLTPFSAEEVHLYIDHRLHIASYSFTRPMFSKQAFSLIVDASEGIPRNVNNICFNALSLGCVSRQTTINADVIREVLNDLDLHPTSGTKAAEPLVEHSMVPPSKALPVSSSSRPFLFPVGWPSRRLAFTFASLVGLLIVLVSVCFFWTRHHSTSVLASLPSKVASSGVNPASAAPAAQDRPVMPSLPSKSNPARIVVQPNQTLYRIIVDNFGRYDQANLNKVRALNPWLTDETRIRVGQTIRLRPDSGSRNASFVATENSLSHDTQMDKGTEKP